MPFNPNLPAAHTAMSSAEMRSQLTGLKALIDAPPNAAGIAPLTLAISDPPTHAEVQAVAARLNELLDALHGVPPPAWTASGFGQGAANGPLTVAGEHNGLPRYTMPGGFQVYQAAADGHWVINDTVDDAVGMRRYIGGTGLTPAGAYTVEAMNPGDAPGGVIA